MSRHRNLAGVLLTLLAAPFTNLFGQTFGEITGEIRDSSGGALVGAKVAATHRTTGAVRSAVSNEAGNYTFPSLQPGQYDLKVEAAGFRTVSRANVELQVQQTARIDFAMQVGQVNEVVEVSGEVPLLVLQ